MRYLIYCGDESDDKGSFYSNFYGGALLRAENRQIIEARLRAAKGDGHADRELKWSKITTENEGRYISFVREVFALVSADLLKIRIMFTQNINQTHGRVVYERDAQFFKLYYQFLKHAFGLQFCYEEKEQVFVAVMLDEVPANREKFEVFRTFLSGLSTYHLHNRVIIPKSDIASVDSKAHVILQAVDVVLGAMQFKLNDKHKAIPEGKRRRAKRTLAKERVYREVLKLIWEIKPGLNIGSNTAETDPSDRWHYKYAHWLLKPKGSVVDISRGKKKRKRRRRTEPPSPPTEHP